MAPKVSVLMSVYNGEAYLRQAIESILNQTFGDFEFIIVDDGSTDRSPEILAACAKQDDRIRRLQNDSNLGLIASLKKGIGFAQGEYLARQDADDISLPRRFESQVAFLDQHPDVGVLGTWMMNVEENGRRRIWETPLTDALIRWSLLFATSMVHASVMMRRSLLDEDDPYRPEMPHAEDYDLWVRLSEKTRFANLPACYYVRRRHEKRVSVRYEDAQRDTGIAVMVGNITKILEGTVREAEVGALSDAYGGGLLRAQGQVKDVAELVKKLYEAYVTQNALSAQERRDVAYDAACILTRIGLNHLDRHPGEALRALWMGLCLSGRIPFNTYLAVPLKRLKER
jgi:glycosyltransferase involved in cell wall biosynthesis